MPIKPENKNRYPKNWIWIRKAVLNRAKNCCEGSPEYPECRAVNYEPHPVTGSRVVLTIAHLDHIPENCDNMELIPAGPIDPKLVFPADMSNLRAWCQKCHLTYDRKHRSKE